MRIYMCVSVGKRRQKAPGAIGDRSIVGDREFMKDAERGGKGKFSIDFAQRPRYMSNDLYCFV